MTGHAFNGHLQFDPAPMAEIQFQRSRLAGYHPVIVKPPRRQRFVNQSDHAELLGGFFQYNASKHEIAGNFAALFAQLAQQSTGVNLAGAAAFHIRRGPAMDHFRHFRSRPVLIVHFRDIDRRAIRIITEPFGGVARVHMIQMRIVHEGWPGLIAPDHPDYISPGITKHIIITEFLHFRQV